jgi:hypothetical protein
LVGRPFGKATPHGTALDLLGIHLRKQRHRKLTAAGFR